MSDKKSPVILKFLGNPTVIVIIALFMFAGIYFFQTRSVRNELNNVLKIKTDTIILELKSITNSSVTNVFTVDEASISKLESSIENILRLENGYTREYVNQIIKNSTDITTFWLAFLSMFMVIFSLFSIYTNNKTLEKTEEEYNKAIEKIEQESKTTIEKLKIKSDDAMKKIQEIETSTKESKKEAKISEDKAKSASLFTQGFNAGVEKKYDLAISDYNKAIELNPKYSEAYNNRGTAYAELKDYNKAIDDYSKAIELNPKYGEAYNNRGCAYDELKEYNKAMDDYNKAIELNPNLSEAYNNKGLVYYKQEKYDLAISDYNKAIELNPKYSEAYCNKGLVYYKQEKYEESMNDFEKVPIDMIKSDEESLDAIKGMAKKGIKRAIEFCDKNDVH